MWSNKPWISVPGGWMQVGYRRMDIWPSLYSAVGAGQPWTQGEPRLLYDSMSEGTWRQTRLCVVIHRHVIGLQMRAERGHNALQQCFHQDCVSLVMWKG